MVLHLLDLISVLEEDYWNPAAAWIGSSSLRVIMVRVSAWRSQKQN